MESKCSIDLSQISKDSYNAPNYIVDLLFNKVYPLIVGIQQKLETYQGNLIEEHVSKVRDIYMLCYNQIKKCFSTLFHIFKIEYQHKLFLQESRYCIMERMSWCINRLFTIDNVIDAKLKCETEDLNESILGSTMYFVNWIDQTFEMLAKLSSAINKTVLKETKLCDQWTSDTLDCITELHVSIDELLLSAMTLCRYCLPTDQTIIKARCQVVLRETKALLSELVEGDSNAAFKATGDTLKLPIKPSNVTVLIDVLKDVLYVLETNTNTALLALLVHCFTNNMTPVDIFKDHFKDAKGTCSCHIKSEGEITEDCSFVKEFDLYNERLMQIGSFAVSCSSDQSRILSVRSGLATLEALDPHLVPALMLSSDSHHAALLMESWRSEVEEIRDSIFLIVDPAAFADKSRQMMHQKLMDITKEANYNNGNVCKVINIGNVVLNFFQVYLRCEPDALTERDKLEPLLADLYKVQKECKIVNNMFCSDTDFMYDTKKVDNKELSFDQLLKRLKLLYTLVNRINVLLHPTEKDEFFDELGEDEPKNLTHTINIINADTYVNSPRKPINMSRSIFARTTNIRSSTKNFPLLKLTKHMKSKKCDELSFSVQLDELVKSELSMNKGILNKHLEIFHEPSVLYNFSPIKHRSSLRKAVLHRHCRLISGKEGEDGPHTQSDPEKSSFMDNTMSLQITDVLNQLNDLTVSNIRPSKFDSTHIIRHRDQKNETQSTSNVLKIDINNDATISKHVWNIPVNISANESAEGTSDSNWTQPSNVTTLERINDLELVESKLSNLKSQFETSL